MNKMSEQFAKKNMSKILCSYSEDSYKKVISYENFQPQSFVVSEKINNTPLLFFDDISYDEWVKDMIYSQIEYLELSEDKTNKLFSLTNKNLATLLNLEYQGKLVKEQIYNQEFIDIIRNVIEYTLYGTLENKILPAAKFNKLAETIMPIVITRVKDLKLNELNVFKLSILSGLSGLDLKGAPAAASTYANEGISMRKYFGMPPEHAAEDYLKILLSKLENSITPVFDWDNFNEFLKSKNKLVWFIDDYIETYFDLHCIEKILELHPNINIEIISKNGRYGNDMSWQDLERIIDNPVFACFKKYFLSGRLSINRFGPLMGAANIKKLSSSCINSIVSSDFVLLKGCRIHEMLQGGLNVDTFSSYVVSRNLSEIVTGYSSDENPLLFIHLSKNEFAFYGVNKEICKKIKFENKKINCCMSTLLDHQKRKKLSSPEEIIAEFNLLLKQAEHYIGDKTPVYNELNMLAEKLLLITKETYDKMCVEYSELRTDELHEFEQKVWDTLVDYIDRYIQPSKPEDIHLLDVGTGHGRDVLYSTKLGYNTKGIDNSDGFIKILKEYERIGKLKPNSIVKCDMRSLDFENESFDVVRQHATLLHLPIIAHGYTVDLALSETHRVLKPKGLMNVIVKTGEGLEFMDSGEGLGGRVFQFFTHKTLNEVITRNGFTILQTSDEFGKRKVGTVSWISVIAQKD